MFSLTALSQEKQKIHRTVTTKKSDFFNMFM